MRFALPIFVLTLAAVGAQEAPKGAPAAPASKSAPAEESTGLAHVLPVEAVVLHRIFREFYAGGEHFEGEEKELGDALGVDCLVLSMAGENGQKGGLVRAFRGDGTRNEDWYGWNVEVLAPFDGVVEAVHLNPVTNPPGEMGKAPASSIRFRRADGMLVLFAHVQDVRIKAGERVLAGQVVARVGNNGYGRCPHIHAGAWKDGRPYQIRWDLRSGQTK